MLAVLWKSSFNCSIVRYSKFFINMSIQDKSRGSWRLSLFYGYPDSAHRRDS